MAENRYKRVEKVFPISLGPSGREFESPISDHMNESRFSNYFIEKWDLSYPRSLAIWGFPLFHVKAPILQNAPNAKLIFLCMAAI